MKNVLDPEGMGDADSAEDVQTSLEKLKQQMRAALDELDKLPEDGMDSRKAELKILVGGCLVDLGRGEEAFAVAREAFEICKTYQDWDSAVQACDVMFQADQSESLVALGNGVWLSVTFPINVDQSVIMLNHIIEETPDDSDGAAVAATVAKYVVDMRMEPGRKKEDLLFFTNNILASVARRHSNVETQEQFDYWFEKLELTDPAKFLPRLRNVVDVMVQEDWWVDREAIWASLPQ